MKFEISKELKKLTCLNVAGASAGTSERGDRLRGAAWILQYVDHRGQMTLVRRGHGQGQTEGQEGRESEDEPKARVNAITN